MRASVPVAQAAHVMHAWARPRFPPATPPCTLALQLLQLGLCKQTHRDYNAASRRAGLAGIGLTVRADGVGLSAGLEMARIESPGLQLAHRLARKLGGTGTGDRTQGTRFDIGFGMQPRGTEGNA